MNATKQLEQLRDLEAADRFEPFTRLAAVSGAGVMIYAYTGWVMSLFWAAYFLLAFAMYMAALRPFGRMDHAVALRISAVFFGNMQIAYGWLPVYMFTCDDRVLVLVGSALFSAQLIFLLRRNDTVLAFNIAQILAVCLASTITYFGFMPDYDGPLAYIGSALALAAMNLYFLKSMRVARRMRLHAERVAQETVQAQKMAAVGQLAGGVAHDFNNNLTAIIGSLELLQMTPEPHEQKIDIDNALLAARQAATTVKQLLIYSRMEKQDVALIQINDVMGELAQLTGRLIPASVTLDLSAAQSSITAEVDRHQLLAALINLVVNSVDAMPKGGSIRVTSCHVVFTEPKPLADGSHLATGTYVEIAVTDTGDGIPSDVLPYVLDPFFTTKPPGQGTGLGLSTVHGMSRELGGGVTIETGETGTTVKLLFPTSDQAQ